MRMQHVITNISVTVIVSIYRGGRYLDNLFEDLVQQDLSDKELILIIDHSPDDSLSKCKESVVAIVKQKPEIFEVEDYREYRYNRVRIIDNKQNIGISKCRSLGISLAKGEYIGFADQDDRIEEGFYSQLYKYAKEKDVDCVCEDYYCGRMKRKTYTKEDTGITPESRINAMLRNETQGGVWNKLFRKAFCIKNSITFGDARLSMCDDFVFLMRFMAKYPTIAYINKAHYWHIFYENSQSHTKNRLKVDTQLWVVAFLQKLELPDECNESRKIYYENAKKWLSLETTFSNLEFRNFMPDIKCLSYETEKNALNRIMFKLCIHGFRSQVLIINNIYKIIRHYLGRLKRAIYY